MTHTYLSHGLSNLKTGVCAFKPYRSEECLLLQPLEALREVHLPENLYAHLVRGYTHGGSHAASLSSGEVTRDLTRYISQGGWGDKKRTRAINRKQRPTRTDGVIHVLTPLLFQIPKRPRSIGHIHPIELG